VRVIDVVDRCVETQKAETARKELAVSESN